MGKSYFLKMKIICAGFPKTGSKSASSALRELGYNVADYIETVEFMSNVWLRYLRNEASIEDVLAEYEKNGFDANQDVPGNLKWEDLYRASPKGTKVILTIRDSDDVWWRSWCGFMEQEIRRGSVGDFNFQTIMQYMMEYGYMGPKFSDMMSALTILFQQHGFPEVIKGRLSCKKTITQVTKNEFRLKQNYRKHNAYVISTVPKEDLLVWNLKDGWEPVCKFLGKSIPDGPIPHDNRTGDNEFIQKYAIEAKVFKEAQGYALKYFILDGIKIGVLCYIGWKEYKTNGKWISTKISSSFIPFLNSKFTSD